MEDKTHTHAQISIRLVICHVTLKYICICVVLVCIVFCFQRSSWMSKHRSVQMPLRWHLNWISDCLNLALAGFLQDFASTFSHASLAYSFTRECDKLQRLTLNRYTQGVFAIQAIVLTYTYYVRKTSSRLKIFDNFSEIVVSYYIWIGRQNWTHKKSMCQRTERAMADTILRKKALVETNPTVL